MSERDMLKLLALLEKTLGAEWVDLADWLRTLPENELAAIETRVLAGDWLGAIGGTDAAALQWATNTQAAYVKAGETGAAWLDAQVTLKDKLIHFDTASDHVIARAKTNRLERVVGFQDEANQIARQITQRAIAEGTPTGINPRRIAQDFRDSIGLAPIQEEWVASYRRALESGDYGNAMRRQLHDDRSNRTLQRLSNSDEALTPQQIDTMVERYRRAAIAYRAENIARTEGGRNTHEGLKDAFDQAIARGDLEAGQLEKEWHSRRRGRRAREMHQAMDGVRVPWTEDFSLPDGTKMAHPHDDRGGAKHNASCGCTSSTTLA